MRFNGFMNSAPIKGLVDAGTGTLKTMLWNIVVLDGGGKAALLRA